jgi:hypothetical protein
MKEFLKRWYNEFKNEQAIKEPLQSMMMKEEVHKKNTLWSKFLKSHRETTDIEESEKYYNNKY